LTVLAIDGILPRVAQRMHASPLLNESCLCRGVKVLQQAENKAAAFGLRLLQDGEPI